MKKLFLCGVMGFISAANASQVEVRSISDFSDLKKSYVKQSPRILAEQVALVDSNQDKDTVAYILGNPHYGTGLLPAKKWEYRFNVVNGTKEVKDCSYLIEFEESKVNGVYTPSQLCVDILKKEVVSNEAQNNTSVYVVKETKAERGVSRADVMFAFNASSKQGIVNEVNWGALVKQINAEKPEKIYLSAHTDSKGSYAYNIELASKRADTVAKELIERGVSPILIEINNVGKSAVFEERKVNISW